MATATKTIRYVVTVTEVARVESVETKEFCTKSEPTEIVDASYNSRSPTYRKEFELREVPKVEEVTKQLYRQELDEINLVGIISAVNGADVTA